MSRLNSIFLAVLLIANLFGQEKETYLHVHDLNGTQITVRQLGWNYPRQYSIEIHHKNMIISKQDTIYDSVVENSWVTDLDQDKNLEVIILLRSAGSGSYGFMEFYELFGNELISQQLPDVNPRLQELYRGHDSFTISEKYIEHRFPAYNESDPNCCPTGGKVIVKYKFQDDKFREMSFEIKEDEKSSKQLNSKLSKLTILVTAALGLPTLDDFSKTDCWLAIFVGQELVGTTKKIQDENSPYFNERFEIKNYSNEPILIKAFDKDMTKDEFIGQVTIKKPISGKYPIMFETANGSIINRGQIEIGFERQ